MSREWLEKFINEGDKYLLMKCKLEKKRFGLIRNR